MKKLTNEQISDIIALYQNGMPPKEIGEKFSIFNNSVTRILRKKGIERNQLERVDENEAQYIIEQYVDGKSSPIIADELGICDSTVCRVLKRHNIAIRPAEENKRTYKIDIQYFKTIDTEDKAYFLGFMYADGNLSKSCYAMRIELHPQDRDVLEKFSNAIYGFTKIDEDHRIDKFGQEMTYIFTAVYCKRMWNDLVAQGCMPDKAFDIRMPTFLSPKLLRHFIRGYFDGDGCISIANPNRPVIDFSSNAIFIRELMPILEKQGIRCGKLCLNKENALSGNVQLTCPDNVIRCYHYLYDGATVFMRRKYDTFQELLRLQDEKQTCKNEKIGSIVNYGTTFIPSYNGVQLTGDNVKLMSAQQKEDATQFLLSFYREHGFPYPILDDVELVRCFAALKNVDPNVVEKDKILRIDNQSGAKIFKHFSPHFFETKSGINLSWPSLLEAFENDKFLLKTIKNRLGYNYSMSGNMLRHGLSNSKIAFKASVFNTAIAKYIYSKHTKENDIIYDYSMGFGQRLVAALSLPYHVKYVGVDAWDKSVEAGQNIFVFLSKNVPYLNKEVDLYCEGSENYCDKAMIGKVDLAFSSPPYYILEQYNQEESQTYADHNYLHFLDWWRKTASNIDKLLAPNGTFIINVNDMVDGFNIGQDMCGIIKERGYVLQDTYKIQLTKNLQFANKSGGNKYEPIYVFKKAV